LLFGIIVVTGMFRIFSTVGLTMGAQTRAFAPSLSALTAAIMASSIEVAEYSLIVTSRPAIFFFVSTMLSSTDLAAITAMNSPLSDSLMSRMVFTIWRRVLILGSRFPDKIL